MQRKSDKIIFSYNTALYLLNKTEKNPELIDITVYKGYNTHRLLKNLKIHYVNKDNLYLSAIKVETPEGFEVTSYNLERTICDLIKIKM